MRSKANLASVNRQLEQAEKRYEVGLIAITDVQEARAAHDSGAAAVIAAKRQLASAQELLREITGDVFDYPGASRSNRSSSTTPDPSSEDRWVEMALQQNLSLVSSRLGGRHRPRERERGARRPSSLARSGGEPLQGDERRRSTSTPTARRTAARASTNIRTSIGIQFTIPIYSGGMVSSQVRQAVYQHRAAKERLERVARQTEHDARDAYLGVLSEISHVKALRRARRIECHRAQRHRVRIRGRHAHRGGRARIAAPVDPGANRLLAQPLRLHDQRAQAAAGGGHPVRAELEPPQRLAQGCTAAAPERSAPAQAPASNGSMRSISRATLPRCASTNSRAARAHCAAAAPDRRSNRAARRQGRRIRRPPARRPSRSSSRAMSALLAL